MFELCVQGFAWGLDTSLKAMLVAVVVGGVLRLLRLQDSHIRHRVWTGVLIGMFLLPVLTPLMPALRLPLMPSPDWLVAWTEQPALVEATTTSLSKVQIADSSTPILAPQLSEADHPSSDLAPFQSDRASPSANDSPTTIVARQFSNSQIEPSAGPQPFVVAPSSPSPASPSCRAIAIVLVFLFSGVWLSVSTLLLGRLAIGLWLAAHLRRASLAIDPAELRSAGAVTPRVHESAGIRIPLTVGCLQPLILLPTGWRKWPADKLHAVLAHEQMHVQRGDCVVALLAELNCCLYWFHPLASWLKAHLAALAEQACDDAAIHSIGDRARYARHLLEVAADVSRNRGRLVPAGLSMARRSNVEQRILSILDFTRPLSRRLTWTKALFVLSVMVPLIALAAALQPFSRPPSNEESPAVETSALDDGPKRPIAGRLIDPEGRPIATASIKISAVISPKPGDSLDKLLQAWKQGRHNVREVGVADTIAPARLSGARTDSEGRFTLPSVPLERMYVLEITGQGIAASMLWVANREGVDVAPFIEARPTYFRQMDPPLIGPDFTHVLLPDFKLTGRVTDDNGKPVAGVDVSAVLEMESHKSVRTDADGRYELGGLPRDQEVLVSFDPSDERLLGRTLAPKARIDEATKMIDVTLKAGILVSGRVTDPQTGKGVHGGIRYVPLPENEHAKQPGYDTFDRDGSMRHLDSQGRFSFLIIPGPGVLVAQAWGENSGPKFGDDELSQYRAARFSTEDQPRIKSFENDSRRFLTAGETIQSLDGFHAVRYVNFAPGSPPQPQNLKLDRGKTLKVDFVDAAGQPVSDVFVAGVVETWPITAQLAKSRETIYALGPDRPRKVFALHANRNLAGVATLTGDEKSPYRFTLQPAATLRGRAVDEGGAPLANHDLGVFFANDPKDQISELYRFFPGQKTTLTTDQDGHFQMKCLVPGEQFYLTYWRGNHHFVGKLSNLQQTAQAAQSLDLGNVIFAPDGTSTISTEDETSVAESDEIVAAKRGESPAQEQQPNPQPPEQDPDALNNETYRFAGTVKDDRGQPLAGASISLSYWSNMPADESLQRLATTDSDGKFSFTKKLADLTSKTSPRSWIGTSLIVVKSGYGLSTASIPALETSGRLTADLSDRERSISEWHFGKPTSEIILPADDAPIRGRIVNSEGQPVAGAKVVVAHLWRGQSGKLDEWLVTAGNPGADDRTAKQHLQHFCQSGMQLNTGELSSPHALVLQPVHSDADGRFTLTGLGRDRIAELYFSGPGIASMTLLARTRPGDVIRLLEAAASPERGTLAYHPATFTCIAPPTAPVEGRVTEHGTDKPIAGWTVLGHKLATNNVHGSFEAAYNHTKTDADGRFRLEGLPLGDNIFRVQPPKRSGYFSAEADVTTTLGAGPIVRDVSIRRGVIARGRVTDSRTGKPVNGSVSYFAFVDNPHLKALNNGLSNERAGTDRDGRYELTILPGSGLMTFMASPDEDFPRGAGADKIEGPKQVTNGVFFRTTPYMLMPGNTNLLSAINPAADATEITHDLTLASGRSLTCRIRREDGHPLGKTYLYGQQSFAGWFYRHTGDTFQVRGYCPEPGRRVMVYQPEGNLIGWQDLTGEVPDEFEIVLKLAGAFVGRIVDNDGAPMEGLTIGSSYEGIDWEKRYSPGVAKTRGELPAHLNGTSTLTDKNGRFELPGVVPGLTYTASVSGPVKRNGQLQTTGLGRVFENASAEAGEKKDLGDLRIIKRNRNDEKLDPKQEAVNQNGPMPVDAKKEDLAQASGGRKPTEAPVATITVTGLVLLPSNQPAANTHVAVIAFPSKPRQGGDLSRNGEVLSEGKTDDSGRFQLQLKDVTSTSHNYSNLIARRDGTAIAWQKLNLDKPEASSTLKLEPEEPIRGRLINLEGQPAANINLRIRSIMQRTIGEWSDEGVGFDGEKLPAAWLSPLTTDQDGRFTVHGISPAHGVGLNVKASDRFAPQDIYLNTGMPEERGERDGTYRSVVRDVKPGEEIVLPLSPAQLFEGTIRYDDTKEPVPHARITIWASQQKNGGSMTSVEGQTDATGRYRIVPRPGIRFGVKAYPPNGAAYLVRQTTDDIRWESGDRIKQVDLTLPPGILIHGKVLTAGSKEPVAGASIQFIPQLSKSQPPLEGVVTDWQGIQVSASDGAYQIAVPLVPGHLLVNHDNGNFILSEIGSRFLSSGKPGGQRQYSHSIQKIDPAPDAKSLDLTIKLQPGAIASGRIVDPQNQPVDNAVVVSRLHIWSHWLTWHGNTERWPAAPGRFELKGLKEGVGYPTHFLDPKRRLGATAILKAGDKEPTIVLEPCGSATVRFLDDKGQPLADIYPNFDIIITPGVHRYDFEAQQAGQLAADSDFIANVDRTNHGGLKTDAEGKLAIPALIPGATYAVKTLDNRRWEYVKEFQVRPGQTLDLGDITQPSSNAQPKAANSAAKPATPTRSVSEGPTQARSASESKASSTSLSPGTHAGSVTVTGAVLLPNGQPAQGATIRAAAPLYASLHPLLGKDFKTPMSEAKTDNAGRFTITFTSTPFGDISKLDPWWRQLWKKTAIAASLPGYGPAWIAFDEVEQQPIQLHLIEDLPIRGRIIDLEGRPIPGTSIKIGEPHAAKNNDLSDWLTGVKAGELGNTVWQKAPRSIDSRLVNIPAAVTTDASGSFEIHGIGRERFVELTCVGETVAHRGATAVTRPMQTLQKVVGLPRISATEPVFGSEFTFTADAARTVTGIVRDAQTGQPLAGVAVESEKLSGYPISNHRVLKTITDAEGRFRLLGMPKGAGNHLLILPNDDQPYFMREFAVPDPVGLGPASVEIDLHRGIWIKGRVTDKATGEPVAGAELHYLPFRSNEFAQKTPEFDSDGNVDGDQSRYKSKADSSFRLVGLPGRAVVGAVSWMQSYRSGVGYAEIDAPKYDKTDRLLTYRNPLPPSSKFPNVMKEINPPADAEQATVDLQLDPGHSVRITVIDPDGNPITGCSVNGLTTFGNLDSSAEPAVTAVNLGPADTRPVLFHHKQKNLGRVITIGPDEIRAAAANAQLQPCATVVGRVLRDDGTPFSGLAIEPRVLPFGDFSKQLPSVSTDADGHFRATLLPGCHYSLAGMGGSLQFVSLADDLDIQAGETKDLGTLHINNAGKVMSAPK